MVSLSNHKKPQKDPFKNLLSIILQVLLENLFFSIFIIAVLLIRLHTKTSTLLSIPYKSGFVKPNQVPETTWVSLNIGRNMHITIVPITTPRKAIISGSMRLVRPLTAVSTCSS